MQVECLDVLVHRVSAQPQSVRDLLLACSCEQHLEGEAMAPGKRVNLRIRVVQVPAPGVKIVQQARGETAKSSATGY